MTTRTETLFHPTTDGFGTLTVRAVAIRRPNPAVITAGFILSLALAMATLYQADRMLFTPAPHVAHGEIFAVDLD